MARVLAAVMLAWPTLIAAPTRPPSSQTMDSAQTASRRAADEADLRRRIEGWAQAIGAMDLERAMAIYAPDVVSFDLEPPLGYQGAEAKRQAWSRVFALYRPGLSYEIRDLVITVGEDVAFSHGFNRLRGTLKSGQQTGSWVRHTACFRKIGGEWRIAHEQISAPVDPASGRAFLELQP